jgi:hypothetical protein
MSTTLSTFLACSYQVTQSHFCPSPPILNFQTVTKVYAPTVTREAQPSSTESAAAKPDEILKTAQETTDIPLHGRTEVETAVTTGKEAASPVASEAPGTGSPKENKEPALPPKPKTESEKKEEPPAARTS